jgi:hypothetical protein
MTTGMDPSKGPFKMVQTPFHKHGKVRGVIQPRVPNLLTKTSVTAVRSRE